MTLMLIYGKCIIALVTVILFQCLSATDFNQNQKTQFADSRPQVVSVPSELSQMVPMSQVIPAKLQDLYFFVRMWTKARDEDKVLAHPGNNLTIFVPPEAALRRQVPELVDTLPDPLTNDRELMLYIVNSHIAEGTPVTIRTNQNGEILKLGEKQVKGGRVIPTVNGKPIEILHKTSSLTVYQLNSMLYPQAQVFRDAVKRLAAEHNLTNPYKDRDKLLITRIRPTNPFLFTTQVRALSPSLLQDLDNQGANKFKQIWQKLYYSQSTGDDLTFPGNSPSRSSPCLLPPEVDTPVQRACDGRIPQWTHHAQLGCVPHYYSSCGATNNLFSNEASCRRTCPPQQPEFVHISAPSDAALHGFLGSLGDDSVDPLQDEAFARKLVLGSMTVRPIVESQAVNVTTLRPGHTLPVKAFQWWTAEGDNYSLVVNDYVQAVDTEDLKFGIKTVKRGAKNVKDESTGQGNEIGHGFPNNLIRRPSSILDTHSGNSKESAFIEHKLKIPVKQKKGVDLMVETNISRTERRERLHEHNQIGPETVPCEFLVSNMTDFSDSWFPQFDRELKDYVKKQFGEQIFRILKSGDDASLNRTEGSQHTLFLPQDWKQAFVFSQVENSKLSLADDLALLRKALLCNTFEGVHTFEFITRSSPISLTSLCGDNVEISMEGCDIFMEVVREHPTNEEAVKENPFIMEVVKEDHVNKEVVRVGHTKKYKLTEFAIPLFSRSVVWTVAGSKMLGVGELELKRAENRLKCN